MEQSTKFYLLKPQRHQDTKIKARCAVRVIASKSTFKTIGYKFNLVVYDRVRVNKGCSRKLTIGNTDFFDAITLSGNPTYPKPTAVTFLAISPPKTENK